MENPYEKYGAHRCEIRLGHGLSWALTFVFLLICTLAPFWRNVRELFRGPNGWTPIVELFRYDPNPENTLYQHLRAAESQIEDAPYTAAPRRWLQWSLTAGLREGNRKAAIGRDGWLYFRPAIDAITGYGPLKPEPDTVAKDPNREPWSGPLDAILKFNDQVNGYGAELILVPIPVKPMIYPENLAGSAADHPIRHRDAAAFYDQLKARGVEVLDLADAMRTMKAADAMEGPVFLKQDTHWTPRGMRASAKFVADALKTRPWWKEAAASADPARFSAAAPIELASEGDLVEKLDLPESAPVFPGESATVTPIADAKNPGGMSVFDTASPLALLGDSFANIYHQESMKWGTNAGFAETLSLELGLPLDTIAQNGQASTGVRKTLATRPGAVALMKKKKAVLWAIAERDLFLSETVARQENIRWDAVEFQDTALPEPPPGDAPPKIVVEAKLLRKSPFQNPKTAPYDASLYAADYEILNVLEGAYEPQQALVFHWAFKNRERLPSANYRVGSTQKLTLVPLDTQTDLRAVNQANDSELFETPLFATEVEAGALPEDAEQKAARIASIATGGLATLLAMALAFVFRRKKALRASRAG